MEPQVCRGIDRAGCSLAFIPRAVIGVQPQSGSQRRRSWNVGQYVLEAAVELDGLVSTQLIRRTRRDRSRVDEVRLDLAVPRQNVVNRHQHRISRAQGDCQSKRIRHLERAVAYQSRPKGNRVRLRVLE